jgi:hypothetical protein
MSSLPTGTFPSRRDSWFVALLFAVAVINAIAGLAIGLAASLPRVPAVVVGLLLLGSSTLLLWCLASTSYRLDGDDLLIRCGPIRRHVPISTIRRVVARRSGLAAPALSTDRLVLERDPPAVNCEISPENPDAFIAALASANPEIARHADAAHT